MHQTRRMTKAALALALTATLAACASKPKPGPMAGGPGAPPPAPGSYGAPMGPVGQGPASAIPGSEQDFVINVGDRIYFDFNSIDVRGDAQPVLDAQAAWLSRYPAVRVRIEGNADERGTREYNFALGARRAESVRNYLVSRGVSPARIETISYGKERPLDPGSDEQAWAKDRNAHTQITAGSR